LILVIVSPQFEEFGSSPHSILQFKDKRILLPAQKTHWPDQDVCVVLNPGAYTSYQEESLSELAGETKNKLYVACSRANRNLYFIPEALIQHLKSV
jgi:ATP-dependent exoDNAse (exonuclease V) beta subunit